MTSRLTLLVVHVVLLVLASTFFTIVTGLGDGQFYWEYFRYFSQRGWGVPYQFPYSLPVVLVYLAAYVMGLVAYCMAWGRASTMVVVAGVVLCGAGFASFAYELTHWFGDYYGSWIASAPIALLALAPIVAFQQYRQNAAPTATGLT